MLNLPSIAIPERQSKYSNDSGSDGSDNRSPWVESASDLLD
jgi:hypothetical protein